MKKYRGPITGLVLIVLILFLAIQKPAPPKSFPFDALLRNASNAPAGLTLHPTGGPYETSLIQTVVGTPSGVLYVGTYGEGVFRYDGERWSSASLGLKDKFVVHLLRAGDLLFAATIRAGLFGSADGGKSWVSTNAGLEKTDVLTMRMEQGTLYVGTGRGVFVGQIGDAADLQGMTWTPFNEGLAGVTVRSLAIGPDKALYAATQGRGIYIRKPGEHSWRLLIGGFNTGGMEEQVIRHLVFDARGVLYAGTLGAGLFKSEDGGKRWARINEGLRNLSIYNVAVLPSDGTALLYLATGDGLFYRDDAVSLWRKVDAEGLGGGIQSFWADEDAGLLYVGTKEGLYRGGAEQPWQPVAGNLRVAPVTTLHEDKAGLTVGTDGKGIFSSRDAQWIQDSMGMVNLSIREFASGVLYFYAATDEGLYRRQRGRTRWGEIPSPPAPIGALQMEGTGSLYAATDAGLFVADRAEETKALQWRHVEAISPDRILLAQSNRTLWAATSSSLWKKQEEVPWVKVTPFDVGAPPIALSVGAGGDVWVATEQAVWRWEDNRWTKEAQWDGLALTALAVDADGRYFVGTDRGLLWGTTQGNFHGAQTASGETFSGRVTRLLPAEGNRLWVATERHGVWLGKLKTGRN
jgi:ligand-binding sensor domain-containing protein